MPSVISNDGTVIGFDRRGHGPPVILVGGAGQNRLGLAPHAEQLASHVTVCNYGRRGRGTSGGVQPYAIEREIDDLEAVIGQAGGSAAVLGASSGAMLARYAAAAGLPITRLALYEPPCVVDDTRPALPDGFVARVVEPLAAGRRGDAAAAYMIEGANLSTEMIAAMRASPGLGRGRGPRAHPRIRRDDHAGHHVRPAAAGRAMVDGNHAHPRDGRRSEPHVGTQRGGTPRSHPPPAPSTEPSTTRSTTCLQRRWRQRSVTFSSGMRVSDGPTSYLRPQCDA